MPDKLYSDKDISVKSIRIQNIPILQRKYDRTIRFVPSLSKDSNRPSFEQVIYDNLIIQYGLY